MTPARRAIAAIRAPGVAVLAELHQRGVQDPLPGPVGVPLALVSGGGAAGCRSFRAAASTGDGGFGFRTDQGAELLGLTADEITTGSARHYAVSRIELRQTLLTGLDDVVRPGREFTRYALAGDRVTAFFADGSRATGDLLIGADGANSRVRHHLLPDAHRVDTGVLTVTGKHPLTATAGLAPPLSTRANIDVPRGRGSLFTAVRQQEGADGYVLWGFADARERFPADVEELPGAALRQVVTDRMPGWAPAFHRLAGGSDPATVTAFRVRSAERAAGSTRLGRAGFRGVLRRTAAVSPIRHAMARRLGN